MDIISKLDQECQIFTSISEEFCGTISDDLCYNCLIQFENFVVDAQYPVFRQNIILYEIKNAIRYISGIFLLTIGYLILSNKKLRNMHPY